METRETVRKMTDGQHGDIVATMAGAIPPDLTFEEAQAIIGAKGPFVAEIRAAFAKRRFAPSRVATFTVEVDYAKTMEEMVEAGGYAWKNSEVNSKNFPVNGKGQQEVELHLIHLNRSISSDDAIKELDKMGLRPAKLPELLALGAQHPDEQRQYPIIALGFVWQYSSGRRCVPALWRGGRERDLRLVWFGSGWHPYCRFLAVRK